LSARQLTEEGKKGDGEVKDTGPKEQTTKQCEGTPKHNNSSKKKLAGVLMRGTVGLFRLDGCPLQKARIQEAFQKVGREYRDQCCIELSTAGVYEVPKKDTVDLLGDELFLDYIDNTNVALEDETNGLRDYVKGKSRGPVYAMYAKRTREMHMGKDGKYKKHAGSGGADNPLEAHGMIKLELIGFNGAVGYMTLGHELGHFYGLEDVTGAKKASDYYNWMYSEKAQETPRGGIGGLSRKAFTSLNRGPRFSMEQCELMRQSTHLFPPNVPLSF
jgi:hypothetical protein